MARAISLSDEAFTALRDEKRAGESDSDVVIRLRREARARRKDPTKFLKGDLRLEWTLDEFLALRETWAEIDRTRLAELQRLAKD